MKAMAKPTPTTTTGIRNALMSSARLDLEGRAETNRPLPPLRTIVSRLASIGTWDNSPSAEPDHIGCLNIEFGFDQPNAVVTSGLAKGELHLTLSKRRHLRISQGSRLDFNFLSGPDTIVSTAADVGRAQGEIGTSGNAGGRVSFADPLAGQLEIIDDVIAELDRIISEALGVGLIFRADVAAMTVHRDLAVTDAADITLNLSDTASEVLGPPGVEITPAQPPFAAIGNLSALTWEGYRGDDIWREMRPIGPGLLRASVGLTSNKSFLSVFRRSGVQRSIALRSCHTIRSMLVLIVRSMIPYLEDMQQLAESAPVRQIETNCLTFVTKLTPLLRIINPHGSQRGARPNPETLAETQVAITTLIRSARYTKPQSIKRGNSLAVALDEMACDPDGVVTRPAPSSRDYVVRPAWKSICKELGPLMP
ncbi:MAG: hypothetical protein WCJ64_08085 [Rhodospirillaceae bacterium]